MDLRKVQPGDDLVIPADAFNAFVDAAVGFKSGGNVGGKGAASRNQSKADSGIISVRNVGSDLSAFAAVGIGNPVTTPNADLATFQSCVAVEVTTPASGQEGRWGVIQEPIKANAFGSAVVAGVTPCQINLTDVSHKFVEIAASNTVPQSGVVGYGSIIWVAGGVGTASATGSQWAIIRLGAPLKGSLTSPKALAPGSGATAATDTWTRDTDLTGFTLDVQTREFDDTTAHVLYYFTRLVTVDSTGYARSVSGETRHTTDTEESCP